MGMFDFIDEKLSDEKVMEVATRDGLPPLRVAINANGYRQSQKFWCDPKEMLGAKLNYEHGVVIKKIWKQAINGKGVVGIRSVYEAIRKVQPFEDRIGIMIHLRDKILQALQDAGIVCVIGEKVYAHPYLLGMYARDISKWCSQWRDIEPESNDLIHGYDADEVRKAIEFYRKAKSLLNGE